MTADGRKVLAVDVGGSHVKLLVEGAAEPRRFLSGPRLTAREMIDGVLEAGEGWSWDLVTVGIPTPVRGGKVIAEPVNLGDGWVGFDYEASFEKPTKLVNDAATQAIGSYEGGRMLFLSSARASVSALSPTACSSPSSCAHLPFAKVEDVLSDEPTREGRRKRRRRSRRSSPLAAGARAGLRSCSAAAALPQARRAPAELPPETPTRFLGGFRLWEHERDARPADRRGVGLQVSFEALGAQVSHPFAFSAVRAARARHASRQLFR